MKILLLSLLFTLSLSYMSDNFKTKQKEHTRVKTAYTEKEKLVQDFFSSKGVQVGAPIFIRAFKQEAELEVWAKAESMYKLIKVYKICSSSGVLGPKRKQGDMQVPEGFYEIDRFNPASNYHLSLGLNYPNKSDKIIGKGNLGGDIFIHGSCVTIGCMPLTDDKIKEVYIMAIEARAGGQQSIPVHVFPCRMDLEGMKAIETKNPELSRFWRNIQQGYRFFEEKRDIPAISVLPSGEYFFQ